MLLTDDWCDKVKGQKRDDGEERDPHSQGPHVATTSPT